MCLALIDSYFFAPVVIPLNLPSYLLDISFIFRLLYLFFVVFHFSLFDIFALAVHCVGAEVRGTMASGTSTKRMAKAGPRRARGSQAQSS